MFPPFLMTIMLALFRNRLFLFVYLLYAEHLVNAFVRYGYQDICVAKTEIFFIFVVDEVKFYFRTQKPMLYKRIFLVFVSIQTIKKEERYV
ncbi:unnamed protein product [Heterobilharzia americana]|nr:unnamed protein product [Heterobilharzia americana]